MTKAKAIHDFFSSFGITAYPSNRIPDDVVFPYLTYQQIIGNNGKTSYPTVNLWYRSDSEVAINAKADQIAKAIGLCRAIPCDDGCIYAYFEESWQPLTDPVDDSITGRTTNITLTFNTF